MIVTALGAAMFFVIGKFVAIPTPIPNFSLFLQFAILVVFGFYFGPVVGLGVGFLGHFLIDLLSGYGLWFSWIIASGVFGLLVGLTSKIINHWPSPYKVPKILIFSGFVVLIGALCWGVIAPSGDILIYAEPYDVVFIEGIVAFATNTGTALALGLPLIYALKRVPIKHTIINKPKLEIASDATNTESEENNCDQGDN